MYTREKNKLKKKKAEILSQNSDQISDARLEKSFSRLENIKYKLNQLKSSENKA